MKFIDNMIDRRSNTRVLTEQAAELKEHPGQWAVITENSEDRWVAKRITMGQYAAFQPAGEYQGSVRSNGDGTFTIYARYLGADGVAQAKERRRLRDHNRAARGA